MVTARRKTNYRKMKTPVTNCGKPQWIENPFSGPK